MTRFDYNQPNTRERIAARRKQTRPTRRSSTVTPGPRRAASAWLVSGRVASLVLLISALGVLLYVFTAPTFAVRDMQVEGAQVLQPDKLIELADARGESIWFVDTNEIVERLKTSPYVEQAVVYVTLPDRLTITVSERRPEVRWQVGGERYLVDGSGLVLGVDGSAPLSDTLVIDDRSNRPLELNDRVDADALKLGRALSLRLPSELAIQPGSISWSSNTGIFITTLDGRIVVFGQGEQLDAKLAVLGALLKDGTPFTYLDLRPSTPYYRSDAAPDRAPDQPGEQTTPQP